METTKIAELAKILKDNGLTKLDLTEGDNRLVLEAVSASVAPAVVMPAAVPVEAVPVAAAEAPAAAPEAPAALEEDLYEQKTPLVGTVYVAPQAGAAPYAVSYTHLDVYKRQFLWYTVMRNRRTGVSR